MARGSNKLTARSAAGIDTPGRHADGNGLYLDVTKSGSRSWVLLFRSPVHRSERAGKQVGRLREMGLGPATSAANEKDRVSLARARELAEDARRLLKAGLDPLDERTKATVPVVRVPTFGEIADAYIDAMEGKWRNEKHRQQWRTTLRDHAKALRGKPVNEIGVDDVLSVLTPIWRTTPETAGRLRGRIEKVLNSAKAAGHRRGENPAAWRGHLENLLPARTKLSRGHHPALPWGELPAFVARLRVREGVAALAVEFLILTACRSGEVRGAAWSEIDTANAIWIIPAQRMKAAREHRVPLVPRAVAILELMAKLRTDTQPDAFVFPGQRSGSPLSDMSLSAVLRRMKVPQNVASIHGFRSSFKDWAHEATSYANELSEAALAHVVGDKVERAYRRGDALARRRELMEAWTRYCDGVSGSNVVSMHKAVA